VTARQHATFLAYPLAINTQRKPLEEYTAYKRVGSISIIVYWALWIGYVIWFGNLMDRYPDLDDFLIIFLALVLIWGPFFAGQLASRFQRRVSIKPSGTIIIEAVTPNPIVRDEYPVMTIGDISDINVHHGLFTGNYIAIELHGYIMVKLYSKRYMLSQNKDFFDLYIALKNAWTTRENYECEQFRVAREQEGFVTINHPVVQTQPIAPEVVAVKTVVPPYDKHPDTPPGRESTIGSAQ